MNRVRPYLLVDIASRIVTACRIAASRLARARWGRLVWSLGVSAFIVGLTMLALGLLPAPATVVVVEGRTEYLRYDTFNPELSAFSTNGMRVAYADDGQLENSCLSGTYTPDVGSEITYVARRPDPFGIQIEGSGGTLVGDADPRHVVGGMTLRVDPTCAGTPSARFPVWGPGRIGTLFAVRSDGIGPLLLEGTMNVFGRTLDLWPLQGGAMYSALDEPFPLPPGGSIWTDGASAGSTEAGKSISPELAAMFGFVALDDDDGLAMSLTTETPMLQVLTPGGSLTAGRIEIGIFAQILNDPNILRYQVAIVLFFFLLPFVVDLLNLVFPAPEQTEDPDNEVRSNPSCGDPDDTAPDGGTGGPGIGRNGPSYPWRR